MSDCTNCEGNVVIEYQKKLEELIALNSLKNKEIEKIEKENTNLRKEIEAMKCKINRVESSEPTSIDYERAYYKLQEMNFYLKEEVEDLRQALLNLALKL